MKKILDSLKNLKVVLFGAGGNGRITLEKLIDNGITPSYFVDNNRDITNIFGGRRIFSVNPPEVLLNEDKSNLKIIISSDWYEEIEAQIKEMGLGECLFSRNIKCCDWIIHILLGFQDDKIVFCCESSSDFNWDRPKFPYLDTAEETILNFLQKRETLIEELNNKSDIDIAKPCINCTRLREYDLFGDNKIKTISVSCYPSICQAKCIYCGVYTNPQNNFENAKHSHYPKMITEMILYLQKNNLIADNCLIIFTPAEITIMPHKDLLLDATAGYRAQFTTNGFVFEPKIADSLKKNGSDILVSLDSGTRTTFKLVKGLDLFEKTVDNLKRYRHYGKVKIKYNILSGVNDSDIDGIIDILKALNISYMNLSFEYHMPLRTAFYPIVKFVNRLKENGLSFAFYAYYSVHQIDNFIERYFTAEYQNEYEQKNDHLREVFRNEFINDYETYKQYVYHIEIRDLIKRFKKGTRFALLGLASLDNNIISTFQKLGVPLLTPNLPYNESYNAAKENADIFIIRNKAKFHDVKAYVESNGGDGKRLLDVEKYYYSFEPAKLFSERNIAEEYLK